MPLGVMPVTSVVGAPPPRGTFTMEPVPPVKLPKYTSVESTAMPFGMSWSVASVTLAPPPIGTFITVAPKSSLVQ